MKNKCMHCPFANISTGRRRKKIFCIVPHCIREFDRRVRGLTERKTDCDNKAVDG